MAMEHKLCVTSNINDGVCVCLFTQLILLHVYACYNLKIL